MEHPTEKQSALYPEGQIYHIPSLHGMPARHVQSRLTEDKPQLDGNQGLEVELGLALQESGEPIEADASEVTEIIAAVNEHIRARSASEIKPEVCTAVVEQNIQHGTNEEVERNFIADQRVVLDALKAEGLIAMPFGMLPHAGREAAQARLWEAFSSHPDPFYRKVLIPRDGESVKALAYMSGVQPHTEQLHGPSAVNAVRALSLLAPFFITLWASSPIKDGVYRGFQSERMREKSALPTHLTGLIPNEAVSSFEAMQSWLRQSAVDPNRLSIAPGYFWVRQPRIEIGTVENAAMDANPDPRMTILGGRISRAIVLATARDLANGHAELPQDLFGDGSLSDANRAWVYGTTDHLQQSTRLADSQIHDLNGRATSTRSFLGSVMDWADVQPVDRNAILSTLDQGTVSERIVRELGLRPGHASEVNPTKLKDVYLQWAEYYDSGLTEMAQRLAS